MTNFIELTNLVDSFELKAKQIKPSLTAITLTVTDEAIGLTATKTSFCTSTNRNEAIESLSKFLLNRTLNRVSKVS